jgi:hypothetical protein
VMPAGDRDHIGCFADQVKLTRALIRDLDEAVKEVNMLGELNNLDDLGDLDEDPNEGRSDVDEWFPQDGSNDRD